MKLPLFSKLFIPILIFSLICPCGLFAAGSDSVIVKVTVTAPQPKERIFIYFNGKRIAMEENGEKYFFHSDHLGSTSVVTDSSGNQVKYTDYQPYGDTKTEEGSLSVNRKFTGKELDDSTGLYDYGARMYDAAIGRFITPDTIDPNLANPQSLNRYSYCLNNPLKYVDPTGEYAIGFNPITLTDRIPFVNTAGEILVFPHQIHTGGDIQRIGGRMDTGGEIPRIITWDNTAGEITKINTRIHTGHDVNRISADTTVLMAEKGHKAKNGLLKKAVKNIKNNGKTVLGHYPGYIEKAKKMGASYFDIGDTWSSLTESDRNTANDYFIDSIADKGDQVYLSTPKHSIRQGSSLERETDRLTNNKGYKWVNQWSLKKE